MASLKAWTGAVCNSIVMAVCGCLSLSLLAANDAPAMAAGVTLKQMASEQSQRLAHLSGADIILESLKRHELYPYVYEEQTLVMTDAKQHHDVRRLHRYSRMDSDGTFKAMIKFVYPASIAGSALIFTRGADAHQISQLYLPALASKLIDYVGGVEDSQMLGSEFGMEDLLPENMHSFVYHREQDIVDGDVVYFVVRASAAVGAHTRRSYAVRKLLVRQDNFFVTRTDYRDKQGLLVKRQTRHDLHHVSGKMWRADMIIMENYRNHYRSILKIDRRVYSSDYVPESMFDVSQFTAAKSMADIQRVDGKQEAAGMMKAGEKE